MGRGKLWPLEVKPLKGLRRLFTGFMGQQCLTCVLSFKFLRLKLWAAVCTQGCDKKWTWFHYSYQACLVTIKSGRQTHRQTCVLRRTNRPEPPLTSHLHRHTKNCWKYETDSTKDCWTRQNFQFFVFIKEKINRLLTYKHFLIISGLHFVN